MSNYTTGEMAKLCGVSVRTVQYYDNRGVLTPSELSEGGRRLYSEEDLDKMKIICFLRELDFSLDNISRLMQETNSEKVISLILDEQERELRDEITEKQGKLERLEELHKSLKRAERFSVESIGDVAHVMENKKKLRKVRATMLLAALPVALLQWGSILLWILKGIWWPFVAYTVIAVAYGIWVSRYYFSRTAYICPECHEIFVPKFKEAFRANHTPSTRKLTCPCCGIRSFCVETYRETEKK